LAKRSDPNTTEQSKVTPEEATKRRSNRAEAIVKLSVKRMQEVEQV